MRNRAALKAYNVGALSRLSGVSVRTLHHYHQIGLLVPASIGGNGYRRYGRDELLRLQQILFYRRLGMSLTAIANILNAPDFDRLVSLREQRKRLSDELGRVSRLLTTIDRTIAELEGGTLMDDKDLYSGLSPEKQAKYEDYLTERYGHDVQEEVLIAKEKYQQLQPGEQQKYLAELADIEGDLSIAYRAGMAPDDEQVVQLIERHYFWVRQSWGKSPSADAYAGLGDLYRSHPDFIARYDRLAQGMAEWLFKALEYFSIHRLMR